jgi:hypothetical protein
MANSSVPLVEASSAMESSSRTTAPDGHPARVAPYGSTPPPLWPQTSSRSLFRSRSMYGRVLAEQEDGASDSEFGLTPRSSTIGYGRFPINSVAGDIEDNVAVKRFWKLPFRSGTIRSSSRRPQTSDGAPVPMLREKLVNIEPALEFSTQLTNINVEHAVALTPTSTLTRPVLSTATEPDVAPLPKKSIRRALSVPRLAPGNDFRAARQRSMSLFQQSRLTESLADPDPSQSYSMFRFQAPRMIPLQKQSPLLHKLSRTLLSSYSTSFSDVREPSPFQLGTFLQPELPRASPADKAGDEESPEAYVERMSHSVNPVEIAGILAAR